MDSYLREFIIVWNNRFPLDRLYRLKYNIGFGSPRHLETNQIDIHLEFLEDKIYKEHIESLQSEREGLKIYNETGKFMKHLEFTEEKSLELFDKLDLDAFNTQEESKEEK